jgi:Zn-dependent protease with chaperone function
MVRTRRLLLGCTLLIASGVAALAAQQQSLAVWALTDAQWASGVTNGMRLGRADRTGVTLQAAHLKNLRDAQQKLAQVSAMNVPIVFVDDREPNGFASMYNNMQVIAITPPLVELIGDDPDAVAALVGHEIAHHKLDHTREQRENREELTGLARGVLGGLARNFGGNLAGAVAGAAVTGIGRSFTRDEERAADSQGLDWAVASGFDACGGYRLTQKLQSLQRGGIQLSFLSTHPGLEERMANASVKAGRDCALSAPAPVVAQAAAPAPAAATQLPPPAGQPAPPPDQPAPASPQPPAAAAAQPPLAAPPPTPMQVAVLALPERAPAQASAPVLDLGQLALHPDVVRALTAARDAEARARQSAAGARTAQAQARAAALRARDAAQKAQAMTAGHVVQNFPQLGSYQGEIVNGVRQGAGVFIGADGERFEGEWGANVRNGVGITVPPSGIRFEGTWRNGAPCGLGVVTWPDGSQYEGEYCEGHYSGNGIFYATQQGYERENAGQWANDRQTGPGVRVWKDGTRWEGTWEAGEFTGTGAKFTLEGQLATRAGVVQQGTFQQGELRTPLTP